MEETWISDQSVVVLSATVLLCVGLINLVGAAFSSLGPRFDSARDCLSSCHLLSRRTFYEQSESKEGSAEEGIWKTLVR